MSLKLHLSNYKLHLIINQITFGVTHSTAQVFAGDMGIRDFYGVTFNLKYPTHLFQSIY